MKKLKSDLWVSYQYGRDIGDIFTTKEGAEKENIENNKMNEKSVLMFPTLNLENPYKVMTLYDALQNVIDYVRETTESSVRFGNEDY